MDRVHKKFLQQSVEFRGRACARLDLPDISSLGTVSNSVHQLEPILIEDFCCLSPVEIAQIAESFYSPFGVAYFIAMNHAYEARGYHPLLVIAEQLCNVLPLSYPMQHAAESHQGTTDGTVKVIGGSCPATPYEEKPLHFHQDGLGMGSSVAAVGLYCDEAPMWGGLNCFQNCLFSAVDLAYHDFRAFEALFHPEVLTLIRRTSNPLKVTGPVLSLGIDEEPQVFLRAEGGDYQMSWLSDPAVDRARLFLKSRLVPFGPNSSFAHFTSRGHGCFFNNRVVLHARTKYLDGPSANRKVSRKWFGLTADYPLTRQIPGLRISDRVSHIRKDLFGPEVLECCWEYDEALGKNIRII